MELTVGTIITGKVTSITKFGAFVALPEGRVGMVHISEVSNEFVQDIAAVLHDGDIVKVQVVEVDVARKRIGLTMKLGAAPSRRDSPGDNRFQGAQNQPRGRSGGAPAHAPQASAMASAFAKLKGH